MAGLAPQDIGSPRFSDQGRDCSKTQLQKLWYRHQLSQKVLPRNPSVPQSSSDVTVVRVGRTETCKLQT